MKPDLPTIFEYEDFPSFLGDYVASRQERQPWFSVRWITRRARLGSSAQLSMLLNRQRHPTLSLVEHVCEALTLSPDECRFAVLLTERSLARSPVIVELVNREIRTMASKWRLMGHGPRTLTVLDGQLRRDE